MIFKKGDTRGVPYDGPTDLDSLMKLINQYTERGPPEFKVCSEISSKNHIFKHIT